MSPARENFGFAKLIVGDLDAMDGFYTAVFGLDEDNRVTAQIGGRTIHEIMYESTSDGGASLVLLTFEDTADPIVGDAILGFVSEDVDALCARAVEHGASIVDPPHDMPEHFVRVAFVSDPEGHLLELVQVVIPEG